MAIRTPQLRSNSRAMRGLCSATDGFSPDIALRARRRTREARGTSTLASGRA